MFFPKSSITCATYKITARWHVGLLTCAVVCDVEQAVRKVEDLGAVVVVDDRP